MYRLSVAPNKHNQALIPSYPLIAITENAFVYIEAECPRINQWYLCNKEISRQVRDKTDCVKELIVNQVLQEACQFTTVSLTKEAMEELDDQHYVLSFPTPTKVHLTCEREDVNLLQGSYLVTIPTKCILRTTEFTITNDNDKIRGQPLKLTQIPYDVEKQAAISTHINLNSINLQGLHNAQDKITLETPIKLKKETDLIYHTTIPFYTILTSTCALIIIALLRRKLRNTKHTKEPEPASTDEIGNSKAKETETVPATFSLNVLK